MIPTVISVVGARPQYVKIAPIIWNLKKKPRRFNHVALDLGQHYDVVMSTSILRDLNIEHELTNLNQERDVQDFQLMVSRVSAALKEYSADLLVIYGDTYTTLAGALAGFTSKIPVVHVEAGLRSNDFRMPEERIRRAVDQLSDLLLTPSKVASSNLRAEGIREGIYEVGNIMEETLRLIMPSVVESRPPSSDSIVCTLHRVENVDRADRLSFILDRLSELPMKIDLYAHHRLRKRLSEFGIACPSNIQLRSAASYSDFLRALLTARGVITDSGGVQVEASILDKPLLVVRGTTEWSDYLNGTTRTLDPYLAELTNRNWPPKTSQTLDFTQTHSISSRIIQHIEDYLN